MTSGLPENPEEGRGDVKFTEGKGDHSIGRGQAVG